MSFLTIALSGGALAIAVSCTVQIILLKRYPPPALRSLLIPLVIAVAMIAATGVGAMMGDPLKPVPSCVQEHAE